MAERRKTQSKKSGSHSNGSRKAAEDKITRENVKTVARIEKAAVRNRTFSELVAGKIADFCGSMTFVWVHVAWFLAWILINSERGWEFDPFPFTFLTLVVSLEAIFLSTFILINQNRETEITERRNHLDLQVNLLAEQENTKMLHFLEKIALKVGADIDPIAVGEDLKAETRPEKIMRQIAIETDTKKKK